MTIRNNNSPIIFIFICILSFIMLAGVIIHKNNVSYSYEAMMTSEPTIIESTPEPTVQPTPIIQPTKEEKENINIDTKETYIATVNMSHYTNERGSHVPSYEGGANDRKGNPLVAYESIAIPKRLYKQLPYGTKIKIITPNGKVYYGKAVDTGGALDRLNRIDRCVSSYKEATSLGVIKNVKIYRVDD